MARRKKSRSDGDPRWTSELRPAPGDLRIVQAFVNTAELRQGTDLAGPSALADRLVRWDLAPRAIELVAGDFERGCETREALRALLAANSGAAVSDETVDLLDKAAAGATIRIRFESGGRARFDRAEAGGLDGALGRICTLVAVAQLDGTWGRLKRCADATCRAAFYDFSRNRSGKWCSARCGSRPGSLAYRRRNLKEIRKLDAATATIRRMRPR